MPEAPPSPSRLPFLPQNRVRSGSSLPVRPSSRLGKRSSPPRDDGFTPPKTDARDHQTFARLPSSSAMATSRIPTVEKQATSLPASGLAAGAAIEAAHKRYRSSSQNTFSRASQGQTRDFLTRRAVSGILPPSSYAERPNQRVTSRSVSSGQSTASVSSSSLRPTQSQEAAYVTQVKPPQCPLRRMSLQPLGQQRQATARSVSSNILPPSKPQFTFTSNVRAQPLQAGTTRDILPEPRSRSAADIPRPRVGSSIRSASDKVNVDQTPSKREAYASGKTERLPGAAAVSAKRKVLDTPAARERGYRRLGNLMLLPGRRSMSHNGADFIESRDAEPCHPSPSAEVGDSRSSTPTQKDFGHTRRLSRAPCSTDIHDYPALAKRAIGLASREGHVPDQTCMTLAALSVNEDTFLVSDDAILADLCAESSRVDFVAGVKPKELSLPRQATTVTFRDRCYAAGPSAGTGQEHFAVAVEAAEDSHTSKRQSDAHMAISKLQEQVNELTRALQGERRSHFEDLARSQATHQQTVEEVKRVKEQMDEMSKTRRREEEGAALAKRARSKSLQKTAGRALVGGAVAGYEGLLRAVAVEVDVVKSEREMCLLLLRNLQLLSSALV